MYIVEELIDIYITLVGRRTHASRFMEADCRKIITLNIDNISYV